MRARAKRFIPLRSARGLSSAGPLSDAVQDSPPQGSFGEPSTFARLLERLATNAMTIPKAPSTIGMSKPQPNFPILMLGMDDPLYDGVPELML